MSDDLLDIHLGIKGTADDVARIVQGITGLLIDAEGVKWTRITDPDGSVSRDGGVAAAGTISFRLIHSREFAFHSRSFAF